MIHSSETVLSLASSNVCKLINCGPLISWRGLVANSTLSNEEEEEAKEGKIASERESGGLKKPLQQSLG